MATYGAQHIGESDTKLQNVCHCQSVCCDGSKHTRFFIIGERSICPAPFVLFRGSRVVVYQYWSSVRFTQYYNGWHKISLQYVVFALDTAASMEMKNVLLHPPLHDKYEALKSALLAVFLPISSILRKTFQTSLSNTILLWICVAVLIVHPLFKLISSPFLPIFLVCHRWLVNGLLDFSTTFLIFSFLSLLKHRQTSTALSTIL